MARRKPTALKILEGNRGHRKLDPGSEPQPPLGVPPAPKHLKGMALQVYNSLAVQLDSLGLMSKVDGLALEGAAVAYARAVEADKALEASGLAVYVGKGADYPIARPEVTISQKQWALFHKFCAEFGLTPASRGKLHVGDTGKEMDPIAEAIFGKG